MDEQEIMVFITKYALTKGIFCSKAHHSEQHPGMVRLVARPGEYNAFFHGEGVEWHRTLPEAVAHAKKMAKKKVASMEAQIAKIKAMDFDVKAVRPW